MNVLLHGSITPDYGKTLKRNVVSHDRIDIPLITERSLTVVGLEYSGYFPVAVPDQKFDRVVRDLPVVNSDTGYLQIGIKGIEEQNRNMSAQNLLIIWKIRIRKRALRSLHNKSVNITFFKNRLQISSLNIRPVICECDLRRVTGILQNRDDPPQNRRENIALIERAEHGDVHEPLSSNRLEGRPDIGAASLNPRQNMFLLKLSRRMADRLTA